MEIIVNSESEKLELLTQSKYIHDFLEIVKYKKMNGVAIHKHISLDSSKAGILMHIYMCPEIISVRTDKKVYS